MGLGPFACKPECSRSSAFSHQAGRPLSIHCTCPIRTRSLEQSLANCGLWTKSGPLSPLFFLLFRAAPMAYGSSQAKGSNRSCSCRPTPGTQQRGIRAASATYTTVHGNAGSLTHWARPGIEPSTSWFLVRFDVSAPRRELQCLVFKVLSLLVFNIANCSAW